MSTDSATIHPHDSGVGLRPEDTEIGLRNLTRMGLTGQAMATFTGGVFVVKILVTFGAPLYVFGLLAALPALAGMVQVPAAYFIERYRRRKRIASSGSVPSASTSYRSP